MPPAFFYVMRIPGYGAGQFSVSTTGGYAHAALDKLFEARKK